MKSAHRGCWLLGEKRGKEVRNLLYAAGEYLTKPFYKMSKKNLGRTAELRAAE
jgi:hypothetical protein